METFGIFAFDRGPYFLLDLPIRDGNLGLYQLVLYQHPPFRPSYQGWKLIHIGRLLDHTLLLDLPIRDGNIASTTPASTLRKLLDLPIRDGNIQRYTLQTTLQYF